MKNVFPIIQVIIAFGLFNVWLVRFAKKTSYRGGASGSMREEFGAYGLPEWSLYVVGGLKIASAVALIAGLWLPVLVLPAAFLITMLMLGALSMHWKVRDPAKKYLPALIMFLLSVTLCLGSI